MCLERVCVFMSTWTSQSNSLGTTTGDRGPGTDEGRVKWPMDDVLWLRWNM